MMSLSNKIRHFLASYRSLSLEKTERVKLMQRMDTKFIIRADDVIGLLHDIRQDYYVLEIESHRTGTYKSVYYDTIDRQMYYAHVTGRLPRYKVRERFYSQNGLKFFEVKQKSNKGRTSKRRISLTENSSNQSDWLSQQTPFRVEELSPSIIIFFERITLVNNAKTERVTLDFNLRFRTPEGTVSPVYEQLAIVELKQEKAADSPIRDALRSRGIRPGGVSKYCIGMLITGCETGYKRYKPKYLHFIKNAI